MVIYLFFNRFVVTGRSTNLAPYVLLFVEIVEFCCSLFTKFYKYVVPYTVKFDGNSEWKKLRQKIEKDTELKKLKEPKRLYKNSLKEKREREENRKITSREYLEGFLWIIDKLFSYLKIVILILILGTELTFLEVKCTDIFGSIKMTPI